MTATMLEPVESSPGPAANALAAPDEIERRLLAVARWLLEGRPRLEMVAAAQAEWTIGRRMAQLYVQRVQRRIAREAAGEDALFYLRLSQIQRDQLLRIAFQYVQQPAAFDDAPAVRALTGLLAVLHRVIDSRDQTTAALHDASDKANPEPLHRYLATPERTVLSKRGEEEEFQRDQESVSPPERTAPANLAAPTLPAPAPTTPPSPKTQPAATGTRTRPSRTAPPAPTALARAIFESLQAPVLPAVCPPGPKAFSTKEKRLAGSVSSSFDLDCADCAGAMARPVPPGPQ